MQTVKHTENKSTAVLKNKKLFLVAALAIVGILLMLLPSEITSDKDTKASDSERLEEYTTNLEKKIAELCSGVQGVSNVRVSVYFGSGFETVYAYNEESKTTSGGGVNTEKKYVTVGSGSGESMVCIVERMPSICGVAVVCSGGGSPQISKELINLISSAYGVPKNNIYVAEGKK